mgnify:CR=1 FL=1
MKTFKQIVNEVSRLDNSEADANFVRMHSVQVTDYPVAGTWEVLNAKAMSKDQSKLAHMSKDEEEEVNEEEESDLDDIVEGRPRKNAQGEDEGGEHIVMQLRKSVSLRGLKDVKFDDGKSVKVKMHHAQKFLDKHNSTRTSIDKGKLTDKAAKSHKHFLSTIGEDVELDEAGWTNRKDPIPAGKELADLMKKKKKERESAYAFPRSRPGIKDFKKGTTKTNEDADAVKEGAMKRMATGDAMNTYKKKPDGTVSADKPKIVSGVQQMSAVKGKSKKAEKVVGIKKMKEITNEDQNYKVSIQGLPTMFISGKSPGEIKKGLRKLLKRPDDMISDVQRVPDADVKKAFRLKAQGKDEDADV